MVNYQLGKIYTIRSSKTEDIYIGGTCQSLAKRFGEHKGKYKRGKGCSSKEIFKHGIDDTYIELLELYPCNSKEELEKREGELIRASNEKCINQIKNVGLPLKVREEALKKANPLYYTCLCGIVVKKSLKFQHQGDSKAHDDYTKKQWEKGLYPDGTPRDPL
jgi:hypothetical protein